jgi:hypothetical protein
VQKDGSEWDVVSAITLFAKDWVKARHMVYVDDADSPTTETEDFEGSDCEGSEAGEEDEEQTGEGEEAADCEEEEEEKDDRKKSARSTPSHTYCSAVL